MKRRPLRQKTEEPWGLLKTSWKYQTGEFFNKSTLHGVRYIAEKDRPFCERFMWFVLTSVGTITTLIIIVSLWEKFQTNPTITGLDTDFHNWEVPFPTVTLCPDDPTNETLINNFIQSTWGNVSTQEISEKYFDFIRTMSHLTIADLDTIVKFTNNTSAYDLPVTSFEEVLYQVVNDCPDVIFDCEWKAEAYNCCQGFQYILTEVGFCYIFNSRFSRGNTDTLRIVEAKDFKPQMIHETDSKWSMVLNMPNVEENNIRVFIHSADEVPTLDMVPQHVWKRTIHSVFFSVKHTYTMEDVRQLSIKQRHCVFPQEIKLLTGGNYTYGGCMMECRMKKAFALCKCLPYFYPELAKFPRCDLKGLGCLAKHSDELTQMSCSCELGCMNTVYEVDKLDDVTPEEKNLEIGFVSWPMVRYKREVLFGWVDLLVSFGGIAGLFLGFSLLSGVEIVYYFTMRSCCMLYRNRDELEQLKHEYENQPRPEINLDLKPFFSKDTKVVPTAGPIKVEKMPDIYSIPYLN
ncbi:sodium channel protein Nach-like [Macrosteles quadrilineatus]|uniref:sodium channel protein Nach-like n=1 Tax=Macrosteles quadrilineatus TaxID=74068 RepID=UPI0023E328E7|nr:sodium channel protein Nach-like [Macrosteles quadrilineatus]